MSPEATAIEDADGTTDPLPPVRGTVRRLFGWIIPVNLSIFVIWGSVPVFCWFSSSRAGSRFTTRASFSTRAS
jgi:hypothetical protein